MGLLLATSAPLPAADASASPRVFLLEGKVLAAHRAKLRAGDAALAPALSRLEREAREALRDGPFSVVHKEPTPPSGDKHDYLSQAPYFWPNPKTTNGLPYIRRDGERNPEIGKISDHGELDRMADAVETLALACYLTGEEADAGKVAELLRAWFLDPATRMNPNLQYAQFVPGVNTGRGIGLIETRSLARVVDAVGLLAGSKAWTGEDQRSLQRWYGQFLDWMQTSRNGRDEAAAKNNHGTYYDMQAVSFALFLDRWELATNLVKAVREKRIAVQIEPDGRQPLELVRTKAWGYSVGNLSGLMLLARLGENVGVDLWHYQTADGRSLRKALDYLVPFAFGEKKWPHAQIGGWPPQMLYPLLREAALKMPGPNDAQILAKLPPTDESSRNRLLKP